MAKAEILFKVIRNGKADGVTTKMTKVAKPIWG